MTRPPTYGNAVERGLLATDERTDIHTFSNGSHWEGWASGNCLTCRWYELDGGAGEYCAFEAAAMLHQVSPALALLFGWEQNPKYADYQGERDAVPGRHGWNPPESCRFHRERNDDEDGGRSLSPEPDPLQLVLIADPTEVIAGLTPAPPEKAVVLAL